MTTASAPAVPQSGTGAESTRTGIMTLDAALSVPSATIQLARFDIAEPGENFVRRDFYWLDLAITPRLNARACFRDHWAAHRFETLGRLFLAPPDEPLRVRGDRGRQTSILCLLQREMFRRCLGREPEWTGRRLEASLSLPSEEVQRIMLRLAQEARSPGFAAEVYAEALAVQLVIELNRFYLALDTDGAAAGGLAGWRLRLIDERLRELRSPPSLSELAALCGLSIRQLTRGFRASRDCSIGDHVERMRIETAKRLLGTGESVKSIAFSMGFGSPSGFCHAFRRATGQTPRQYQTQLTASAGGVLNECAFLKKAPQKLPELFKVTGQGP